MPQKHTQHSCVGSPYVPRTLQMQLMRINICRVLRRWNQFIFVENNFIDSLGIGWDSNPDPSALKPSECTTTPSTSSNRPPLIDLLGFMSYFGEIVKRWSVSNKDSRFES
jgi:hypothetical protein